MPEQPGLRQRKRDKLRAEIVRIGVGMFLERGYEATTIPEIASVLEVSPRTIHRYFPVKEQIVLAALESGVDQHRAAVVARPAHESPLVAAREALRDLRLWNGWLPGGDGALEIATLIDRTPPLADRLANVRDAMAVALGEGLALRMQLPEDAVPPRVIARSVVACATAAQLAWIAQRGARPAGTLLQEAFDALDAAVLAEGTFLAQPLPALVREADPPGPTGLRDRKLQRVRQALIETAFRLFLGQGYDATTVDQIAAAADVSPRTFFRYFATKEEVIFDHALQSGSLQREALLNRPAAEPPFLAARNALRNLKRAFYDAGPLVGRDLAFLIESTPALRTKLYGLRERWSLRIAEGLGQRMGTEPLAIAPLTIALTAQGTSASALERWVASEDESSLRGRAEEAFAALHDAIAASKAAASTP